MRIFKHRWAKLTLGLAILLGAGAYALHATCSDICPPSCPMHGSPLKDCTVNYDSSGNPTGGTCNFQDGCSYSNSGGGSGSGGHPGIQQKSQ